MAIRIQRFRLMPVVTLYSIVLLFACGRIDTLRAGEEKMFEIPLTASEQKAATSKKLTPALTLAEFYVMIRKRNMQDLYFNAEAVKIAHYRAIRKEARALAFGNMEKDFITANDETQMHDQAQITVNALHVYLPRAAWSLVSVDKGRSKLSQNSLSFEETKVALAVQKKIELYCVRLFARTFPVLRNIREDPLFPEKVEFPKGRVQVKIRLYELFRMFTFYLASTPNNWRNHHVLWRLTAEMAVTPSTYSAKALANVERLLESMNRGALDGFQARRCLQIYLLCRLGSGAKGQMYGAIREPVRKLTDALVKAKTKIHIDAGTLKDVFFEYFGAIISNHLETMKGLEWRVKECVIDLAFRAKTEKKDSQVTQLRMIAEAMLDAYCKVKGDLGYRRNLYLSLKAPDSNGIISENGIVELSLDRVDIKMGRLGIKAEWARRKKNDEAKRKSLQEELERSEKIDHPNESEKE